MKKIIITITALIIATIAANAQSVTFENFLQQFPKATLPYTLGEQDLRGQLESRASNQPVAKAKRLGWEYYDFLPTLEEDARENRMPVYPEPIAALETEKYYAVIYNTGRNFARQYKTYNIAVFDKAGNFVSSRCIAGVNPTALASATIDENLQVTIKEYSVNWAKDYVTNGIEGNTIVNLTPTSVRTVNATAVKGENEDWKNQPEAKETPAGLTAQTK